MILRPSPELQRTVEDVAKKLLGIHGLTIDIDPAHNAIEAAKFIDYGRRYGAIIIQTPLEDIEINYLLNLYHSIKRKPPLLLSQANYEKFVKRLLGASLTPVFEDFNRDFLFDYLKETFLVSEKKIDIRIIKEVLISVTNIIYEKTQVKLEAIGISEVKAKDSMQEMSAVIAFIGDGVMGTLSIATNNHLVSLFCQRIRLCEAVDVTPTLATEVLNELTEQILSTFRQKLAHDGYELIVSMQFIVSGATPHTYQVKSNGHYYHIKLKHEADDFNLSFAYGNYMRHKGEPNFSHIDISDMSLDVRILNAVLQSVGDILHVADEKPIKIGTTAHKGEAYQAQSIHVLHGRGHKGSFLLALDIPLDTVGFLAQETMGLATKDLTPDMVNDICGELINQIVGLLKKRLVSFGYDFINVYHGDFCSKGQLNYLLKNQGLYCRLSFELRGRPFTICFGMESVKTNKMYDIWGYVESLSQSEHGKEHLKTARR
jgi:CheY-specific phosphatase CheX